MELIILIFIALILIAVAVHYSISLEEKNFKILSLITISTLFIKFVFVPLIYLVDNPRLNDSIKYNNFFHDTYNYNASINVIVFLLSVSIILICLKSIKSKQTHKITSDELDENSKSLLNWSDYALLALSFFFSVKYFIEIERVPLIALLQGETPEEVLKLRTQVTTGYLGKLHWVKFFTFYLPLFQAGRYFLKRKFKSPLFIFNILIFSWASVLTTEKASIIYALALFFILFAQSQKNYKKLFLVGLTVGSTSLLLITFVFGIGKFSGLFEAAYLIFERIIITPFRTGSDWLEFIAMNQIDSYQWPFLNPRRILPVIPFDFGKSIYTFKFTYLSSQNYLGTIPGSSLFNHIIYYGISGILLWVLKLGLTFTIIQKLIQRSSSATRVMLTSWTIWFIIIYQGFEPNILYSINYTGILLIFFLNFRFKQYINNRNIKT